MRGKQGRAAFVEGLDESGELRPAVARDREVDAQVEERDLADAGAGAHGGAEAVGEAGPVFLGEGLGLTDEHADRTMVADSMANILRSYYAHKYTWHYIGRDGI